MIAKNRAQLKAWIKKPLDKGTRKVLNDGFKVIIDKKGYFKNITLYK